MFIIIDVLGRSRVYLDEMYEVLASCLEAARPKPSEPAAAAAQDTDLGMDVDALSTRVESTTADLKELKETLTQQASKMQATMKVVKQELRPGGGKMNAKAAAAVAGAGASGETHMKERNRTGRHAPY